MTAAMVWRIAWLFFALLFNIVLTTEWEILYEGVSASGKIQSTSNGTHIFWIQDEKPIKKLYVFDIAKKTTQMLYPKVEHDLCFRSDSPVYANGVLFSQATCLDGGPAVMLQLNLNTLVWRSIPHVPGWSPSALTDVYLFLHQEKIHLYGGVAPGWAGDIPLLWIYEQVSGQYTLISASGTAPQLFRPCRTYYQGAIYVTGGEDLIGNSQTGLWIFTFENRQWQGKEAGFAFGQSCALTMSQNMLWIYSLFIRDSRAISCLFSADARQNPLILREISDSCSPSQYPGVLSKPSPRRRTSLFPILDGIILAGGFYGNGVGELWIFNTVASSWVWSSLDSVPMSRSFGFFGHLEGSKYLLFGGVFYYYLASPINDLWIFNSETNTWTCLMREHNCSANSTTCAPLIYSGIYGLYNGTLYVMSGSPTAQSVGTVFRQLSIATLEWSALDLLDIGSGVSFIGLLAGAGYAQKGSVVWALSSATNVGLSGTISVFAFDLQYKTKQISPSNTPSPPFRIAPACTIVENRLFMANGYNPGFSEKRDIWYYDLVSQTWAFVLSHDIQRLEPYAPGILLPYHNPILILTTRAEAFETASFLLKGDRLVPLSLPRTGPGTANAFVDAQGADFLIYSTFKKDITTISISRVNLASLFCEKENKITVLDLYVLEDGSGDHDYILGTNCTWTIHGAAWIYVDFVDVGLGASLVVDSYGFDIPYNPPSGFPTATSRLNLTHQNNKQLMRMQGDSLTVRFEVSAEAVLGQGFILSFIKCRTGFIPINKKCVCPSTSIIVFTGDCIEKQHLASERTDLVDDHHVQGPRLASFSAYLANAFSLNDSIYILSGLKSANMYPALQSTERWSLVKIGGSDESRFRLQMISMTGEMPNSGYGACSLFVSGFVWFFGGVSLEQSRKNIYALDTRRFEWSKLNPTPFSDVEGQACVSDGKLIYITGGYNKNSSLFSQSHVYDIELRSWTNVPGFRNGPNISYACGAFYQQAVYLFGGWDGEKESNLLWMYRTETTSWTFQLLELTTVKTGLLDLRLTNVARQQASVWMFGSEMHIFGGRRKDVALDDLLVLELSTNEIVDFKTNEGGSEWPPFWPQARFGAAYASMGDVGYLIGGATDTRETAHDSWIYLPEMRVWIENSLSHMPLSRRNPGFTPAFNQSLIVFGGTYKQERTFYLNDLWLYHSQNNTWHLLSSLYRKDLAPEGRELVTVGEMSCTVYVFGGRSERFVSDGLLWIFSTDLNVWSYKQMVSVGSTLPLFFAGSSPPIANNEWILMGMLKSTSSTAEKVQLYALDLEDLDLKEILARNEAPSPRYRSAIGVWNQRVIVCGGIGSDNTVLDDVWIFSRESHLWTKLLPSIGRRRLLPAYAFYMQYVIIVGERAGLTNDIQLLDADSGLVLNGIPSQLPDLTDFSGHNCVWNKEGVWIYGGQTSNIYNAEVFFFQPATCLSLPFIVQGETESLFFGDGSLELPYFSPRPCFWKVRRSNVFEIKYSLSSGDRIVISALVATDPPADSITLEGNGTLYHALPYDGFTLELHSNFNLSDLAPGFQMWHAYCPPMSLYKSRVGCQCMQGYEMDKLTMQCVDCTKSSCLLTSADEHNSEFYALEIALPAIMVALLFVIIAFVWKHYKTKLRGYRVKYERRMMLADKKDFVLEFDVRTERLPSVFRGSLRGHLVEIDVIRLPNCSPEFLDSKIDQISSYRHPNIQLYMGACIVEDGLWIAMEWLGVGTLSFVLKTKMVESMTVLHDYLLQVAHGMAFLHNSTPPVVHGNLSSATILIDGQNRAKISGTPRVILGAPMDVSHELGQIPWCAPERLRDDILSTKSDVYSFGIITWEIASGKYPDHGFTDKLDLTARIVHEGFRPSIPGDCLFDFRILMEKCWSSSPNARPCFMEIVDRLKDVRIDKSSVRKQPASHIATTEESHGVYVLAIRIWREDYLWAVIGHRMKNYLNLFHEILLQTLGNLQANLRVEADGTFWITTTGLDTCINAGLSLLSSLADLSSDQELQTAYDRQWPELDQINGIRVQLVISGTLQDAINPVSRGILQRYAVDSCLKMFEFCHGGQMIAPRSLEKEMSTTLRKIANFREVHRSGSSLILIEIMPLALRSRSRLYEQYDEKATHKSLDPNYVPHEPPIVKKCDLETHFLDWNDLKQGRILSFSCALPFVWATVYKNIPLIAREVSVRNAGFDGGLKLKHDIFLGSKWEHPHLPQLVGCCFHKFYCLVAIKGDSFSTLDCYIKSMASVQTLNAFRHAVAFQTHSALSYLQAQDPPQVYMGVDWRNIRVVGPLFIQLGFPGYAHEFSNDTILPLIRIGCRAPEVISRKNFTAKGDVYSFGILLWEIANLSEAYDALGEVELAKYLYDGHSLDMSRIQSQKLQSVLLQLCHVDMNERPSIESVRPDEAWWR